MDIIKDKSLGVNELIDGMQKIADEHNAICSKIFTTAATVEVEANMKIMIVSDVHLGSKFTDYKLLKSLYTDLKNNDFKVLLNGDLIDNYPPNGRLAKVGVDEQIIPPSMQRELYQKLLEDLAANQKLIAINIGNHEEFSDLDFLGNFKRKYPEIPLFLNRGRLFLLVGNGRKYEIALVHKSRFNSFLNPTHSAIRELTLTFPGADAIITSHTHIAAYQLHPYNGRQIHLIKTPSFKQGDPFAVRYYDLNEYETLIQCLVIGDKITYVNDYRTLL